MGHTNPNNKSRRKCRRAGKLQTHARYRCIEPLRTLYRSSIGIDRPSVGQLVHSFDILFQQCMVDYAICGVTRTNIIHIKSLNDQRKNTRKVTRRQTPRLIAPPIPIILFLGQMPGKMANPHAYPPTSPPRCPAKSTVPSRLINTEMTVMMPMIQHSCDLIWPSVFQLMVMQAISPPNVPNIMVDAPTLMESYLLNKAEAIFPILITHIPQMAEAKASGIMNLGLQHFYSLLKKNNNEIEFMVMWSKSACKKAAVTNLHTYPARSFLELMAPNLSSVQAVGANTRLVLVSMP